MVFCFSRPFLFLLQFFLVLLLALSFSRLILSLSFLCSSVSEALFAFLSEVLFLAYFLSMLKLLLRIVEMNKTGSFKRPKLTLSIRMFGPRNSAYAFWHMVDICIRTYRHIYVYHAKSQLNSPLWGSLRSPNYIAYLITLQIHLWIIKNLDLYII